MWRLATVLAGGSLHRMDQQHSYFRSESAKLREAAYEYIPEVVRAVCDEVGWTPGDVELACGHQVTEELVYGLLKLFNVPAERSVVTVTDCGNTAAASIPLALARAYEQGKLKPGTKVMLAGGAAGFSVGVIALVW
jgi:3-oxoacyl-[acyl-carrier-protein] synthase-3